MNAMFTYFLFIFFLILWVISFKITAKVNVKEFNFSASKIFVHEIKSCFIIGILFIIFYSILPSLFKLKYSYSIIYGTFVILDIFITILILVFVKKSDIHGFYQKTFIGDQLSLQNKMNYKEIEIVHELDQLLDLDDLYKNEIIQLIKHVNNGKTKLEGPVKALIDNTTISEVHQHLGVLIVKTSINNTSYLNKTLHNYYDAISNYGLIILNYKSYDQVKLYKVFKKNPWLKYGIYPWYFFITRAIPKIRILEKLYFLCTNNKYKTISKSECWGRLHYTGFEVLGETEYNGSRIIIARKSYTPSLKTNPSYYPIIKLRRVSLNGKIVMIFKIRSMFPYSEYIQKKVFETGSLSSIGKFSNDFRITGYGQFIRKYYLDEIMQLINFLRGDIKIVGIRPISEHYFSLYPDEYQQLYYQVKPGFFSPLPETEIKSFSDVVKLEQKYLEQYIQSPIRTDVKYFFKIVSQLLFQKRLSS
jgi:lipopolysaccharide/colanic/teichoic acid biosynthesis glycosyltransferase